MAAVALVAILALPGTGSSQPQIVAPARTVACLKRMGEEPIRAPAEAVYGTGMSSAPRPTVVYVLRDATILAVFPSPKAANAAFQVVNSATGSQPFGTTAHSGPTLAVANLLVEFSPVLSQHRYDADENHIRLCAPGLNHTDPPAPYRTTYVGSAAIDHGRALIPEPKRLPVYPGELNVGVVFHGGPRITGFGPSCTGERCPVGRTVGVRSPTGKLISHRTLKVGQHLGLWLGDPGRYFVSAPGCTAKRVTVRLKRRTSIDLVCRLPH